MTELERSLEASSAAVRDLAAAAQAAAGHWDAPRAPGKWSPSQLVEHVALALEESARVCAGEPSRFPTFPVFVRPLVRGLFYRRVLRTGRFPKARTNKAMDPPTGASTPAEGQARLAAASIRFEQACRALAAQGRPVNSTVFGPVSVESYVRFQELHTRHHLTQLGDK